jgi:hypothetical protein
MATIVGRSSVHRRFRNTSTRGKKGFRNSHERERGEGREEMLDLYRSSVAVELSTVFDSIAMGHDAPFTIFDRSSLLRWTPRRA